MKIEDWSQHNFCGVKQHSRCLSMALSALQGDVWGIWGMGAEAGGMAVFDELTFSTSHPRVQGKSQITQGQRAGFPAGTCSHCFLRQACCRNCWLGSLCSITNTTQRGSPYQRDGCIVGMWVLNFHRLGWAAVQFPGGQL